MTVKARSDTVTLIRVNDGDQGPKGTDGISVASVVIQYYLSTSSTSMTGGCLPLLLQMPIIFALYRIIMNIPAYVPHVYSIYENVMNAIGGSSAAQKLVDFATDNGMKNILAQLHNLGVGENVSYTADQIGNFIIDFLYKLNPSQWTALQGVFTDTNAVNAIQTAAEQSAHINNFLGINLSTAPSAMGFVPNVYWIIPILAGLLQYLSAKLMTAQNAGMAEGNAVCY